jgi:hypothetical protein
VPTHRAGDRGNSHLAPTGAEHRPAIRITKQPVRSGRNQHRCPSARSSAMSSSLFGPVARHEVRIDDKIS